MEVVATEYAFDLSGVTSVPSGLVEIALVNNGEQDHLVQVWAVPDGVGASDLVEAMEEDPTGGSLFPLIAGSAGGPNAAPPGGGSSAITNLEPGRYAFADMAVAPDGVFHLARGMAVEFEVTAEGGSTTPPDGEVTVGLDDFVFAVPEGFEGQGTIEVTNNGEQDHELAIFRLAEGATVDDALTYLAEHPPEPPPFTAAGGLSGIAPGTTGYIELDLEAGEYMFICFIPDPSDGAPHFAKGMVQQVTVP